MENEPLVETGYVCMMSDQSTNNLDDGVCANFRPWQGGSASNSAAASEPQSIHTSRQYLQVFKALLCNDHPTFREPSVVYRALCCAVCCEVWVIYWRALIGQTACCRFAVTEL